MSKSQGGMVFLNTTAGDLDGETVLPIPTTSGCPEVEVLITGMEGTVPPVSFPLTLKAMDDT